MMELTITPNIEEMPWTDLGDCAEECVGVAAKVGLLPGGMASGEPSFAVAVRLPDGSHVIGQASWRQMRAALHVLDESPIAPKLREVP